MIEFSKKDWVGKDVIKRETLIKIGMFFLDEDYRSAYIFINEEETFLEGRGVTSFKYALCNGKINQQETYFRIVEDQEVCERERFQYVDTMDADKLKRLIDAFNRCEQYIDTDDENVRYILSIIRENEYDVL